MVKYDQVCNNVFKGNVRHVKKDNYQITLRFLNFVLNEWRKLDSLISLSFYKESLETDRKFTNVCSANSTF